MDDYWEGGTTTTANAKRKGSNDELIEKGTVNLDMHNKIELQQTNVNITNNNNNNNPKKNENAEPSLTGDDNDDDDSVIAGVKQTPFGDVLKQDQIATHV